MVQKKIDIKNTEILSWENRTALPIWTHVSRFNFNNFVIYLIVLLDNASDNFINVRSLMPGAQKAVIIFSKVTWLLEIDSRGSIESVSPLCIRQAEWKHYRGQTVRQALDSIPGAIHNSLSQKNTDLSSDSISVNQYCVMSTSKPVEALLLTLSSTAP